MFSCEFCEIFMKSFFKNTYGGCFCIYASAPHLLQSPQHHQFLLHLLLYPNANDFVLVAHLNILDTISTKNVRQHFGMHIFSPTNHYLQLLQNQFLPQFYFHDLSFSHTINNLVVKCLTHHRHVQSTNTSHKTVSNSINDNFSLPIDFLNNSS